MRIPLYQIDAFADGLFTGNPAAVCPLQEWLPDALMQSIAAENNLSETAFFVRTESGYHIRWFTPLHEVELCGHATLASAHVIFRYLQPQLQRIEFESRSGKLIVIRENDWITLNFPRLEYKAVEISNEIQAVLNQKIVELYKGPSWLAVLENEQQLQELEIDFQFCKAKIFAPGLIVTAPAVESEADFVSRAFFRGIGVDEDPVTGSAHCVLTPYWAQRLHKDELIARQISRRGGFLKCKLQGNRVFISGKSVEYLKGEITV